MYTSQKCPAFSEETSRIPSYTQNAYRIPRILCIPARKVSHFLRKGLVYSRIPRIPSYTRIPNSELRHPMEDSLTEVSYTLVYLVHLSYTPYTMYTGQKCPAFSKKTSRIPSYNQNAYRIPRILCIPARKVSHFLRKGLVYSRIPRILSYTPYTLVYPYTEL